MEWIEPFISGAAGAALITAVAGFILYKIKRRDSMKDAGKAEIVALRMLMYDRIKHNAKACIARGYITSEELEDLISMHKVYHDVLHGNGFLDELMEAVKHLPIR